MAFDVVSIRPGEPGAFSSIRTHIEPNGYSTKGQSLRTTMMIAYFPQSIAYWGRESLHGAPAWIDDVYDIEARVSDVDLAEWQKQGSFLVQKTMLQRMLQTMLAERCKLAFHRIPATISGYALETAGRGPRLTEAKPGAPLPQGIHLPEGGVLIFHDDGEEASFFGTTMAAFADHLSQISAGHPVVDRTGLKGRYNFVLSRLGSDPDENGTEVALGDADLLRHWDLEKLGLKTVPHKVPTETMVIDHIEKPSAN